MDAQSCKKIPTGFECVLCQYNTTRKSSIDKHNLSNKHISRQKLNELESKSCNKQLFACNKCEKTYTARNSLWYHLKKCNQEPKEHIVVAQNIPDEVNKLQNMVIELMNIVKTISSEGLSIKNNI